MNFNTIMKEKLEQQIDLILKKSGVQNQTFYFLGHPEHLFEQPCKLLSMGKPVDIDYLETTNQHTKGTPVIIFDLDHSQKTISLLQKVREFCVANESPLFVCLPNLGYKDLVFSLIAGNTFDFNLKPQVTSKQLETIMEQAGFFEKNNEDFLLDSSSQLIESQNPLIEKGTPVNDYLSYIKEIFDTTGNVFYMVREYIPMPLVANEKEKEQPKPKPFLSIITRTQGTRIAELREILLCLTAQTHEDFELLIVGHKVKPENEAKVLEVIEDTPASFQKKVRYISVDHGNRSTPLNVGFSEANGTYLAIVDDDDIVMDNWVEAFYKKAKKNDGKMIHAYSVSQNWKRNKLRDGLEALDQPNSQYCKDFNYIKQLRMNSCPLLSFAFPAWIYNNTQIKFDEKLDTTEDWDLIMRSASLVGVVDVPVVTSIYRLWKNAENSYSLHSQSIWHENESYVRRKLNQAPVLLEKGSVHDLVEMSVRKDLDFSENAYLYFNEGYGFTAAEKENLKNKSDYPHFHYEYTFSNYDSVKNLRIDLTEQSGVVVDNLHILVTTIEDDLVPIKNIQSNGYFLDNQFVFIKEDPQIYFQIPKGVIPKKIKFTGSLKASITEKIFRAIQRIPNPDVTFFFDQGNGFNPTDTLIADNLLNAPQFKYIYALNMEAKKFRFDPIEMGGIILHDLAILIEDKPNQWKPIEQSLISSNGYKVENQWVFLKPDPQIHFNLPHYAKETKIMISGSLSNELTDEIINKIIGGKGLFSK